MEKEWLNKKNLLKNGTSFSAIEQQAFVLDAAVYNDLEGIHLAIKHNFELNAVYNNSYSIWFHLAKDVLSNQSSGFAIQALSLLAKFNNKIVYSYNDGRDLLTTAICKNDPRVDYFTNCNFDHLLAKNFYHRYLIDLQDFKFEGDLRIFVILAINLYCDGDAIHLALLHGLRFDEVLCQGDNIAHVIARTVKKYDTYGTYDENLRNKCLRLKEFIESPLVFKTNEFGKLPEDLGDFRFSMFSSLVQHYKNNKADSTYNMKDELWEQLYEMRNTLSEIQRETELLGSEEILVAKDYIQDMRLADLEIRTINGVKEEEIPNVEEVNNLEEYLNSIFVDQLADYMEKNNKILDGSSSEHDCLLGDNAEVIP